MDLRPYLFVSLFIFSIFFLSPFEDNGLFFWVPNVLCQHLEVVLWNLLSVQMFFWWICGGESGLPVLFLSHLRTLSCSSILITPTINKKKIGGSFILSPNKCKFIYELFSMFLLFFSSKGILFFPHTPYFNVLTWEILLAPCIQPLTNLWRWESIYK